MLAQRPILEDAGLNIETISAWLSYARCSDRDVSTGSQHGGAVQKVAALAFADRARAVLVVGVLNSQRA
jgi:hypothetical protein